MEPFKNHQGLVALLDRVNVDTDQIIPKQFLKRVERSGFGQFLFYDWMHKEDGTKDPEFELNQPRFQGATLLVTRHNFGCGSSREHAPWALADFGFRAVLAPSFADIFHSNCLKNGLLPIVLRDEEIEEIFKRGEQAGYELIIDLEGQQVRDVQGLCFSFDIDQYRKSLLLQGLDDIGVTLQYGDAITDYEQRKKAVYQV